MLENTVLFAACAFGGHAECTREVVEFAKVSGPGPGESAGLYVTHVCTCSCHAPKLS